MKLLKDIYLIRHGETDCNQLGIVQGSGIDAPLNDTGKEQAVNFFKRYMHINFDKVYASTLQRTQQTIEAFTNLGIDTEYHSGLNEISWGDYEGQMISRSDRPGFHEMVQRWNNGEVHLNIDNGESPLEVAARQKPVIDLIFSRNEEKTILICMHGRAMKIFLTQLLNRPLHHMDEFSHRNVCLYHLKQHVSGKIEIERENCVQHLQLV